MQENRAPNQLEGAQLMNLPNFEEVLQKKAGVYTKNFQVRGGARAPAGLPCLRHWTSCPQIKIVTSKYCRNSYRVQILQVQI
jgi:hypothetical protein